MAPSGAPDTGPDTAAIRASLDARGTIGPLRTYDLCDALDAARAEEPRTGWTYADLSHAVDSVEYWKTRAEAAEARIAELEAPFHRVRPRPEGTCHRNLHYPPANSECCWDYR